MIERFNPISLLQQANAHDEKKTKARATPRGHASIILSHASTILFDVIRCCIYAEAEGSGGYDSIHFSQTVLALKSSYFSSIVWPLEFLSQGAQAQLPIA